MDAGRFTGLYASEAREQLGLLNRSVLALESPTAPADAVGEAFRAAHTLKGVAAAMGHDEVAELAHTLEDRLEEVRAGRARVDPALVDLLLASVDALESAVATSLKAGPRATQSRLRIRLRDDTPLKGARATLIEMALRRQNLITATEPASFGQDFDGEFTVVLAPEADRGVLEAAVRNAGDVESVAWEDARGAAIPVAAQVRVDARKLDALATGIGELTVLHARERTLNNGDSTAGDRVALVLSALQDEVMRLRMLPVSSVLDRLPRAVRDAARAVGKNVNLALEGGDIELDRAILDELGEPLLHLVRNAVDHGIERPGEREAAGKAAEANLVVHVERERTSVCITVRDDGRGVSRARVAERAALMGLPGASAPDELSDDDLLRILSHPGFSTADQVTELSGRGVGLDAVVTRLRSLGGALMLSTEAGRGTTFTLRLPLTLALAHALRVRIGGEDYAIPLTHVAEAVELQDVHVSALGGREAVRVRDDLIPLIRLRAILGVQADGREAAAVVAELGDRRAALAVDELVGREQILIKTFDAARGALPIFSGATLLADGRPALVLDPMSVV